MCNSICISDISSLWRCHLRKVICIKFHVVCGSKINNPIIISRDSRGIKSLAIFTSIHVYGGSFDDTNRDNWDSTVAIVARPVVPLLFVMSFFFLTCNSCHQSGYPYSLKHISRMCLELPQLVHFPSLDCPLDFISALIFACYFWPNLTPLVAMTTPL